MRRLIQLAIISFGIIIVLYEVFLSQPLITPPATRTPCDPNITHYLSSTFSVQLSKNHPPQTDKPSYRPGDNVAVSGYVVLLRQDIFLDDCHNSVASIPVRDDPQNVTVAASGPLGPSTSKVQADGSYTITVAISSTTVAGRYQYQIVAQYKSPAGQIYSDTAALVIVVQ